MFIWRSSFRGGLGVALWFGIILFSQPSFGEEEINFKEIFGSDLSLGGLSDTTDLIIAPLVLFENEVGEVSLNVRIDGSVASVEREGLLSVLKEYLKLSVYEGLSQNSDEFLLIDALPEGLNISLDSDLRVAVELQPSLMQDINPEVYTNEPREREILETPVRSMSHDIDVNWTYQDSADTSIGVESTFRYDRFALHGLSLYSEGRLNIFKNNYLLDYEHSNKNYSFGYLQPTVFADLAAKRLYGFAVYNTSLNNYIVLESDPRYINLLYPSEVKLYVNDTLYSTQSYSAGRHRLAVPLDIRLARIRMEITDEFGRSKTLNFSLGGAEAGRIQKKGQVLFFAGIGEDDENETMLYTGVKLGINAFSQISAASSLYESNQQIALRYFRIFQWFKMDAILQQSYRDDERGERIGLEFARKFGNSFRARLRFEEQRNFVLNNYLEADERIVTLFANYIISNQWLAEFKIEKKYIEDFFNHRIYLKYHPQKDLSFTLSHEDDQGEKITRLTFNWHPYERGTVSGLLAEDDQSLGVTHAFNSTQSIEGSYKNDNWQLTFDEQRGVATNRYRLDKRENYDPRLSLDTRFSVVAAGSGLELSQSIGNSGFVLFRGGETLSSSIGVAYSDYTCQVRAGGACVLKIATERHIAPEYSLNDIGFDKSIIGIKAPFLLPERGGVVRQIEERQIYYVQGVLIDTIGDPIAYLVGGIESVEGEQIELFTDDVGGFFIDLTPGSYLIKIPGYKDGVLNLKGDEQINEIDGVINIGAIELELE